MPRKPWCPATVANDCDGDCLRGFSLRAHSPGSALCNRLAADGWRWPAWEDVPRWVLDLFRDGLEEVKEILPVEHDLPYTTDNAPCPDDPVRDSIRRWRRERYYYMGRDWWHYRYLDPQP